MRLLLAFFLSVAAVFSQSLPFPGPGGISTLSCAASVIFSPTDLVSNTSHSPFVITSSSDQDLYLPHTLFDIFPLDTKWLSNGASGGAGWIKVDIGAGKSRLLCSYTITADSNNTWLPKTWTMQGSNDDSNWDVVDTVASETGWSQGETRVYTADVTTTLYRYFKINVTVNNGSINYVGWGTFTLSGVGGTNTWFTDFAPHNMTSGVLPAPYVVTASGEQGVNYAWQAFDGREGIIPTSYEWLMDGSDGWLKIDLGSGNAFTLDHYQVYTESNDPARGPKNWTMQGSNDDLNWDTVDTVTGETGWTVGPIYIGEGRQFDCDVKTTSYRYFQIVPTLNNGSAYTGITELLLFRL